MGALYGVSDYTAALLSLLPRGRAWCKDVGSTIYQTAVGLAGSCWRADGAAQALLVDAFPPTAVGLLAEWEETLGLPDPCQGPAPTLSQRQKQVAARLTFPGGQSVAFFEFFASTLGFGITVDEFVPFRAGQGRAGDPACNDDWAHIWRVDVDADPPQPVLECELRNLKPAHTLLFFQYGRDLETEAGVLIDSEAGAVLTT